jgi:large subunit ribosomal protein L3
MIYVGSKVGMTTVVDASGRAVGCTVVQLYDSQIVQKKNNEKDNYEAIQIGFKSIPQHRANKPSIGHFAKHGTEAFSMLTEVRVDDSSAVSPEDISLSILEDNPIVKVTGLSKGRGFAGVVKRHNFAGVGMSTHGQSDRQRAPGSIGMASTPSRVFKGMKMGGRYGGKQNTIRNLQVLRLDKESRLVYIKGSIPGSVGTIARIEVM